MTEKPPRLNLSTEEMLRALRNIDHSDPSSAYLIVKKLILDMGYDEETADKVAVEMAVKHSGKS